MKRPTHAYIGKLPCGCAVSFAAYNDELKDSAAEHVADMIKDGLTVSCLTWEEYEADKEAITRECAHGKHAGTNEMQPYLV